jgi:periplasmic protein TonB
MFDAVTRRSPARWPRRLLAGPLSVAIHSAVIGSVVAASSWFVGEIPDPPIRVVFYEAALPGPPAGGGGGVRRPTRSHRAPIPVRSQTLSAAVAISTPVSDAELATGENPEIVGHGGQIVGSPGSVGDGPPGGLPSGEGSGGSEPPPIVPGPEVDLPVLVARVEPIYPEAARRMHLSGVVLLEAIISTHGEVENVRVLRSAHPLLDAAAVRAVSQWRYRPATLDGRAVRVYLTVTVDFTLR